MRREPRLEGADFRVHVLSVRMAWFKLNVIQSLQVKAKARFETDL